MNPTIRITVFAVALGTGGCTLFTEPGCDICTTSAVVRGEITGPTGAVSGALLSAEIGFNGCDGPWISNFDATTRSAVDGSFALRVTTLFEPGARCVLLHAAPPAASGLLAHTDTLHAVSFQADFPSRVRRDSVAWNVNLIVSP